MSYEVVKVEEKQINIRKIFRDLNVPEGRREIWCIPLPAEQDPAGRI
jgi:hypothetical protein